MSLQQGRTALPIAWRLNYKSIHQSVGAGARVWSCERSCSSRLRSIKEAAVLRVVEC